MSNECSLYLLVDNVRNRPLTTSIESYMMHLNRTVVLDCPHLDVPWFRNKASQVFLGGCISAVMFFHMHIMLDPDVLRDSFHHATMHASMLL